MKTTFTRTIAGMLAAVLFLLTLAGCGKEPEKVETFEPSDGPGLSDLVETDKLVIYTSTANLALDRSRTEAFKRVYDVDVELVVVPFEEYDERVINDLASGSGPDVIHLYEMFYTDIDKAALNHSFLDLTNVLAEDPDVNKEDYFDGVFEACQHFGRQYVIPLSWEPPLVASLQSKLDEMGFHWDKIDTMSDYLKELARLTPEAAKDPNFKQMFYSKNTFIRLLATSGIQIINYETGEVLPDEKAFREFMEAYKSYFPYDYNEYDRAMWHRPFGYDVLTEGQCAFWFPRDPQGLPGSISVMKDESFDYVIESIPAQTGESIGTICGPVAINANSPNSLNAYRYIKFLLSEESQKADYMIPDAMPILKEALREKLLESPKGTRGLGGGAMLNYEERALTEDEVDMLMDLISGTDRIVMNLYINLNDVVYDTMLPFFKAEDSYKNCLAELRSKLTFYLSE